MITAYFVDGPLRRSMHKIGDTVEYRVPVPSSPKVFTEKETVDLGMHSYVYRKDRRRYPMTSGSVWNFVFDRIECPHE